MKNPVHVSLQLREGQKGRLRRPSDQVCPWGYSRLLGSGGKDGFDSAAEPVASDGVAQTAPKSKGHPRRTARAFEVIREIADPDRTRPCSSTALAQVDKRLTIADPPDQADSRLRPLRRRAFRIARPARSDMRWRNPWRRDRRRLLGWNVRFTEVASSSPGNPPRAGPWSIEDDGPKDDLGKSCDPLRFNAIQSEDALASAGAAPVHKRRALAPKRATRCTEGPDPPVCAAVAISLHLPGASEITSM